MSETAALGPELETIDDVVRVEMPTLPPCAALCPTNRVPPLFSAHTDTEGYSVMAVVGDRGSRLESPSIRSLEMDNDHLASQTGNLPEPEDLFVHRHRRQSRKPDSVPVEPRRLNDAQLGEHGQGLDASPPAIRKPESWRSGHGGEPTEPDAQRSIGWAGANGWDVVSPSQGTTLPPYAP